MPETARNKDLNFTLSYFNECLSTCFPDQPLCKLMFPPLQMGHCSPEKFSLPVSLLQNIFRVKFKANASLGQAQDVSASHFFS